MKRPYDIPRNDVEASLAWVRERVKELGHTPPSDEMRSLARMHDDPTELWSRLPEVLSQ